MGNNIRAARINAGYSQKEVAITLRVASPSVSDWENGKKNPSCENLMNLADLFGVSTDYLLGRESAIPSAGVSSAPSADPRDADLVSAYHAAPPEIRSIVDTALSRYKTQNPAASGGEAM